ncbi:MAG: DUF4286 family protein [Bacteroidia bacterium]
MIVYNVTININADVHDEFIDWFKHIHLPEVMQTGMFTEYKFYKLLTRQHDENGDTYVVQYFAKNIDDYNRYQQEFAPALQQKTKSKFGDSVLAFRTIMELQ